MNRIALILAVVCGWLVLITGANMASLVLGFQSTSNISTLLLSGKTSSAESAKKTSQEVQALTILVQGLQHVQNFDHQQTENQLKAQTQGNKIIGQAIASIETHLDKTIKTDVNASAKSVENQVLYFNEHVLIPTLQTALSKVHK